MVDLKGQYAPIKELVNSSIQEVIDTASFINGPKVKEFQANLEEAIQTLAPSRREATPSQGDEVRRPT